MELGRNDLCWCGSGRKYKKCHAGFDERLAECRLAGHEIPPHRLIKTPDQIAAIRRSAAVNIAVLDAVAARIGAGVTTGDIDRWVAEETARLGGVCAPLGFEGYPKSVCVSVNDQVCHGIPSDDAVLQEGDIVNVDVSTIVDGYFSDSSRMFCIGAVDPAWKRLVEVTRECVQRGLEQVRPWGLLGDVGHAVHAHAAENGYSVVREIGGHGVGLAFHEDPWVSFTTAPGTGMVMAPGMMFTIEPMVNLGAPDIFQDADNGWTIYTDDGLPSAQWEIQVLVTGDGHEVIAY